jgi:lambda family phage portal protein
VKRFFANLVFAATVGLRIITNRYEAGQRGGTSRSFLPAWVQDARFDADSATRTEILRKSRYFERNNGIVNRLADLFEQYVVGANGLQIIPSSANDVWNEKAQLSWTEWQEFCDLTSLQSFAGIQSLVARSWFIDGEIFILLTRGDQIGPAGERLAANRPRIQLIEAHRVETPSAMWDQEGKTIIDGIQIDKNGRPTAYWVRDNFDGNTYTPIPANRMIHVFEACRPGQYRGLPFLYPVMNDLHDLDDLQLFEMKAAKEAAEITNVVENGSGEISSAASLRRERVNQTTQNASGVETTESRTKWIRDVLGGRSIALKLGESFKQFVSERPSVATKEYWDYITSKVCAGTGISKMLVFPWSLQGTIARGDYDIANAFFRSRSAVLASAFTRVYLFYMEWAKSNDSRIFDPPGDWKSVTVRPPRGCNVDIGRNSQAMLAELEAGATTYDAIYGALGLDYRRELRKKAKEAAYIRALATEFKITPGEIASAAAAAIQAAMQSAPTQPQQQSTEAMAA